jgi:hypothetical protein
LPGNIVSINAEDIEEPERRLIKKGKGKKKRERERGRGRGREGEKISTASAAQRISRSSSPLSPILSRNK